MPLGNIAPGFRGKLTEFLRRFARILRVPLFNQCRGLPRRLAAQPFVESMDSAPGGQVGDVAVDICNVVTPLDAASISGSPAKPPGTGFVALNENDPRPLR